MDFTDQKYALWVFQNRIENSQRIPHRFWENQQSESVLQGFVLSKQCFFFPVQTGEFSGSERLRFFLTGEKKCRPEKICYGIFRRKKIVDWGNYEYEDLQ